MADTLEKQASDAFIDEDFDRALQLYTQAIAANPNNSSSLLASRAQAHIKLNNFTDAISDCNRAIELDPSMSKAYRRKGIACFELQEYQTAKAAFAAGAGLEPSTSFYEGWIKKCDAAIAAENLSTSPQLQEVQPKPVQTFRLAHYQNINEMVVEIFAKNLKPGQVKVDFGVQLLRVVIDCPPSEPYTFQMRLNQKVLPEKCKYNILSTKLEIRLAKAESMTWKSLEYIENQTVLQAPAISKAVTERKLEYPSSSKKGYRDWDRLEAQVKKEEKDEKLEGDAALNKLFKDIYSNADENTRRAMNKSFVESNGTVLSTNWKDVGKKFVEGSAPSGMEMKKWET